MNLTGFTDGFRRSRFIFMPSRTANIIAFLTIASLLVSSHVFVFRQLRSLILRDFPARAATLLRIAKAVFIYFDLPFLYLFFFKSLTSSDGADLSLITTFLIYPFAVWQFLMIVWTVILLPAVLFRTRPVQSTMRRMVEPTVKPILVQLRRKLRTRTRVYSSLDATRVD